MSDPREAIARQAIADAYETARLHGFEPLHGVEYKPMEWMYLLDGQREHFFRVGMMLMNATAQALPDRGPLKERIASLEAQLVSALRDTARLDWLSHDDQEGGGLISDDAGRWAFSISGMLDIIKSFFVEAAEWKPSVRDAIDSAMEALSGEAAPSDP